MIGTDLQVAPLPNSGGWKGAYSKSGEFFEGPWSDWSGVVVELAKLVSKEVGFNLNITKPPDFLKQNVKTMLGATNPFDHCLYATTLGYVDMCLAQYAINTRRALTGTFIRLESEMMYLVVHRDKEKFGNSIVTVFAPLKAETWFFIIVIVLPILGLLTLYHEYGNPSFPKTEPVVIIDKTTQKEEETTRKIPIYHHAFRSLYFTYLAVLRGDYDLSVISTGAKINTIGIVFFFVIIIAVYTANLASFFTVKASQTSVTTFDEAITRGWRFCGTRVSILNTMKHYPQLKESSIVPDPIDLGGDGLPGFDCKHCAPRRRILEKLDPIKARTDPTYCHASIALREELEKVQSNGEFCDLTLAFPLFTSDFGIPVSKAVSQQLTSIFLKVKIEGQYTSVLRSSYPSNQCTNIDDGSGDDDLAAVSILDLTGIWAITFFCATLGVLITFCERNILNRHPQRKLTVTQRRTIHYDQALNPVDVKDIVIGKETNMNEEIQPRRTTDSDTSFHEENSSDNNIWRDEI